MEVASALPQFAELPAVVGQPKGCAWGLWGKDDQLGRALNKITPDVIRTAASEVRTGRSASLDLPLHYFSTPFAGRKPFEQKFIDYYKKNKVYAYDDEVSFNTQCSSQWDGLKHHGDRATGLYYNNLHHNEQPKDPGRNGTQKWVENGGLVGRGILLDWAHWREETGQPPINPGSSFAISVEELEEVAKYQKVEFKQGDLLFIRVGYTVWWENAAEDDRANQMANITAIGTEASMKTVEWLWNKHFSAVATDSMTVEVCPPPIWGPTEELFLHDWILAMFGMPLGEFFNLEPLARICREERRWSFMVTSAPLYVHGGVATPPNAIAIL